MYRSCSVWNRIVDDRLAYAMWNAIGADRLLVIVSSHSVVRTVRCGESVTVVDPAILGF